MAGAGGEGGAVSTNRYGLATGGGGLRCSAGPGGGESRGVAFLAGAALLAASLRRRRAGAKEVGR